MSHSTIAKIGAVFGTVACYYLSIYFNFFNYVIGMLNICLLLATVFLILYILINWLLKDKPGSVINTIGAFSNTLLFLCLVTDFKMLNTLNGTFSQCVLLLLVLVISKCLLDVLMEDLPNVAQGYVGLSVSGFFLYAINSGFFIKYYKYYWVYRSLNEILFCILIFFAVKILVGFFMPFVDITSSITGRSRLESAGFLAGIFSFFAFNWLISSAKNNYNNSAKNYNSNVTTDSGINPNQHYVHGYTKQDGTHVHGYRRTNPNGFTGDNISSHK